MQLFKYIFSFDYGISEITDSFIDIITSLKNLKDENNFIQIIIAIFNLLICDIITSKKIVEEIKNSQSICPI